MIENFVEWWSDSCEKDGEHVNRLLINDRKNTSKQNSFDDITESIDLIKMREDERRAEIDAFNFKNL